MLPGAATIFSGQYDSAPAGEPTWTTWIIGGALLPILPQLLLPQLLLSDQLMEDIGGEKQVDEHMVADVVSVHMAAEVVCVHMAEVVSVHIAGVVSVHIAEVEWEVVEAAAAVTSSGHVTDSVQLLVMDSAWVVTAEGQPLPKLITVVDTVVMVSDSVIAVVVELHQLSPIMVVVGFEKMPSPFMGDFVVAVVAAAASAIMGVVQLPQLPSPIMVVVAAAASAMESLLLPQEPPP